MFLLPRVSETANSWQYNDIGDYTTKEVISGVIKNLVKYTDIAQLLIDLAENFGSDTMGIALMDASIDKYIN